MSPVCPAPRMLQCSQPPLSSVSPDFLHHHENDRETSSELLSLFKQFWSSIISYDSKVTFKALRGFENFVIEIAFCLWKSMIFFQPIWESSRQKYFETNTPFSMWMYFILTLHCSLTINTKYLYLLFICLATSPSEESRRRQPVWKSCRETERESLCLGAAIRHSQAVWHSPSILVTVHSLLWLKGSISPITVTHTLTWPLYWPLIGQCGRSWLLIGWSWSSLSSLALSGLVSGHTSLSRVKIINRKVHGTLLKWEILTRKWHDMKH